MSKKTNKFSMVVRSGGTTETNIEGSEELVRDIAEMLINPIENHKVDRLERELLRTNATVDSEISQLHKKHEELERSKSIQNIKLEQLEKKIELENKHYIKFTDHGISVKDEKTGKDVKVSDEYRVTSDLNNGMRIELIELKKQ